MRRTAPGPSPAARPWGDSRLLVRRDEGVLSLHTEHERPLPGGCQELPVPPGHLAARLTAAAARHPALADTVVAAVGDTVQAVWLTPSSPAPDHGWLPVIQRISNELAIDVLAPDGLLAGTFVSGLYAGHGTGATGWYRFSTNGDCSFAGTRFPLPDWDSRLPRAPIQHAGVRLEPVLAGLVARTSDLPPLEPGHPAGRVPLELGAPVLILDSDRLSPDELAAVLRQVPLAVRDCVLLPLAPATADPAWLSRLADRVNHDLVVRTPIPADGGGTDSEPPFRPFPAVIRHSVRSLGQEVLDSAPPPRGWHRHSPTAYRLADGPSAQVVPGGLILHDAYAPVPDGPRSAFDPARWTLTIGVAGTPVSDQLLAAAEQLLGVLTPDRIRTARVRVAGELTAFGRERLLRNVVHTGVELDIPRVSRDTEAEQPTQVLGLPALLASRRPAQPAGRPQPAADAVLEAEAAAKTQRRRIVVPTELIPAQGTPVRLTESPRAAAALVPAVSPASPTAPRTVVPDAPAAVAVEVPVIATESAPPQSVPLTTVDTSAPASPAPREVPRWPDQASTPDQQTRFAAAAGEAFTEGLSLVNSALAAWPVLRGQAHSTKTDYVAVCLYLTRGPAGANALNADLRAGRAPEIDSYPACLASGLARLPVHRSALLRQAKVDPLWTEGTVVTDSGFLSASVHDDIVTPDARADLLIWPSTAHRTTELAGHRVFGEAVFLPGRRFKVLAVRRGDQPGPDGCGAPSVAYLAREIDPRETDGTAADQAALTVLDQVLAKRRNTAQRLLDDPDIVDRLTTPMVVAADPTQAAA